MKVKKFICDAMVGKLAKYMRSLGIDTEYVKDGDVKKIIEKARKEQRVILTRKREWIKIAEKEALEVYIVKSQQTYYQLIEVLNNYRPEIKPFSRCPVCNTELIKADKEQAKGNVPFYVYETHSEFMYCPKCKKFYWEGSHTSAMKRFFKRVFDSLNYKPYREEN